MDNQKHVDDQAMGPVCDRCKIPLVIHGSVLFGAGCDMALALTAFGHAVASAFRRAPATAGSDLNRTVRKRTPEQDNDATGRTAAATCETINEGEGKQ